MSWVFSSWWTADHTPFLVSASRYVGFLGWSLYDHVVRKMYFEEFGELYSASTHWCLQVVCIWLVHYILVHQHDMLATHLNSLKRKRWSRLPVEARIVVNQTPVGIEACAVWQSTMRRDRKKEKVKILIIAGLNANCILYKFGGASNSCQRSGVECCDLNEH